MLKLSRKPEFPVSLFIVAALATFLLLGAVLFFLESSLTGSPAGRYYVKNQPEAADPLITKIPGLKDILDGPILSVADPSQGADDAAVTIVEFSDYQCSYCLKQEKNLQAAIKNYPGKIRLIWKDYPEANPASLSFKAAVAARCAGQQNKYWAYHDLLFAQPDLTPADFLKLAAKLNLNQTVFAFCLTDDAIAKKIQANITEADALGIGGIPFIFINRQEIMGQTTAEELKNIINAELNNYGQ